MAKEKDNVLEESLLELKNIEKVIAKSSTNQIKDIFTEAIKKELKNIITEAPEEEEEENDDIEGVEDTTQDTSDVDVEVGNELNAEDEVEVDDTDDTEGVFDNGMEGEPEEEEPEGEEDFDLDSYKTGEDEYDLTNSSIEDVVKVFKKINDDDSVIVKKLDNGKIELSDSETGAEYLIDLECSDEDEEGFEMEDDEVTSDDDNIVEEEDSEIEIELDGDEDAIEEKNMTQSIGTNRRVGKMSQTRKEYAPGVGNRDGAKLIANEARKIATEFDGKVKKIEEKYRSELSAMYEELNKYKNQFVKVRSKLKEYTEVYDKAMITNNNLGKCLKVIIENATTKDEKIQIAKRFANEAKTIDAGNKLFESITSELNKKPTTNIVLDKQLSEPTKQKVNEQVIYESNNDLKQTIDLMKRINSL